MAKISGTLDTGLGQFVSNVNPGGIGGGGIAVPGWQTMPDGEGTLGFLEGDPSVAGADVGLIIPAGARTKPQNDPRVQLGKTMVTIPGISVETQSAVYSGENPGYIVDPGVMFPVGPDFRDRDGTADDSTRFIAEYVPGLSGDGAAGSSDMRVLVPNGQVFVDRHGPMKSEEPETIEPGETVELSNTILAGPTDELLPAYPRNYAPGKITGDAKPLALGGATFGLAALSTPSASIGGEEANPLVHMETTELLQTDQAREILRQVGLTDADEVEWLAGPDPLEFPGPGDYTVELLGEGTSLELFGGIVRGDDGPWAVAAFVARGTPDDHVAAAATIRRPLWTAEEMIQEAWPKEYWPKEYIGRAGEFAAETMSSLAVASGDGG